ncbi:type I secretion system outer membrane protein [Salmonella enterica subsp. enterica serovar Choleraesuis]|nr:type I secretion system outer membrane protein [Salmonella enterica subsp. enterica serovar Choleraesuis]
MVNEARSAWFPHISMSGSTGHNRTTDSSGSMNNSAAWGLTITQLVYDFGRTNSSISQANKQRDSYRYELMQTFTNVGEKTSLAYIEILRYQALIGATEDGLAALENVRQLAEYRADAGLNSRSEVLQTETRIGGMRATLEQYRAALASATARFGVITGITASKYQPLPNPLALEQKSITDINYSQIPSVMAAEAAENSSEHAVARAKSEHYPSVSVQGGRTRYESSSRSYWDDQIQMVVDAPIYQGGAVNARIFQAQQSRKIAASKVEQAKFDVLQKASVALADWRGAEGREGANQIQHTNALRTRDVYKDEYTLGKRSLNDLLSVEQDVYQAAYSQIIADYDGWTAAVNYAAAVDNLLPLVGIQKNVTSTLPDLK